ncbi:hypothetical protein VNO77_10958 [Canavalia gladiata]|uniref:non-specific serine/threonine protein kinase n=1 Tax=Canavalia gladiata TaxID=3824 RepID=A0AAN9QV19_CANGL
MFSIAPYAPAFSPATKPPLPAVDDTPPPLLEPPFLSPTSASVSPAPSAPLVTLPPTSSPPMLPLAVPPPSNSAPPATSPVTSSPPTLSLTVPMPSNSAPPVKSPATPAPPVTSLPSPNSLLVPPSSPLITSKENPDSPPLPPPSPVIPLPLTVPLPSPAAPAFQPPPIPFVTAPAIGTFPPLVVTSSPPTPTATYPPPSAPALSEEMPRPPLPPPPPLPTAFTQPPLATPVSPMLRPTSSDGGLPVAVEVQKLSAFHMSSGFIIGLVIVAIIFSFILATVTVLCRNRKKSKLKNPCTFKDPSPSAGLKGSHVIRVLSNPTLSTHLTRDSGASGSVNSRSMKATPNHAPSVAFGSVNGIFTYDDLIVATNRFSESNLLGEGGFGYVYKGVLPCGKEIAVKQLKSGSQQGEREFQAEVETISRVHHKHLVELVGYCVTRSERLLVYEFVPNNTLEFHLHGEGKTVIDWATRIKIALGSAKGLAYLHEDCNPAIIHRDIKASNILLDFKFEAKVSDFGLAKLFPNTDGCITHLTTRVVGTFGYLAPEYASSGKLTDKSDVYSYGVMLLELITGRPPITAAGSRNESLVDWARPLLAQALQDGDFNNLVDPRLLNNYEADEMARMITCAAACVRHSAWLRPRMSQIVGALEGVVSLTDLVGDNRAGHNILYSWSDSSDYDGSQYQQDIRNFNLALSCQKYSSSGHGDCSYGLHPSGSNSDVQIGRR